MRRLPSAPLTAFAARSVSSTLPRKRGRERAEFTAPSCAGSTRASIFLAKKNGLQRNSGLPEFRSVKCRKSDKSDLRCQARQ